MAKHRYHGAYICTCINPPPLEAYRQSEGTTAWAFEFMTDIRTLTPWYNECMCIPASNYYSAVHLIRRKCCLIYCTYTANNTFKSGGVIWVANHLKENWCRNNFSLKQLFSIPMYV